MSMNDQVNTDDTDADDDDPRADHQVTLSRKDIRNLEKKGKGFDEATARADALARELVFAKAGVDVDSDAGRIFARGYDGELTTEAVKQAASAFNLTPNASTQGQGHEVHDDTQQQQGQPDGPTLEPGEADLTRERQAIGQSATRDEGVNPDPYNEALDLGRKVIDGGGKIEEGIGTAINMLASRAHDGDKRVTIDRRSTAGAG